MKILRLLAVASAAFFFASSALAQTSGTVTNHAFALGKGAGQTGFTSLLCGSAQLAVGQTAADPICRTLTGDVTIDAAGVTAIGTAKVTSAMLRNSAALSVIGRSANSAGVPADITCTAASDAVLRESGSVLGCGTVATAGIANNAITDAKIRQSAALSLVGRSANSTGNVADISAVAASSCAFRESSSTIGCGTLATAALANNAVTYAKMQQAAAFRIIGNPTGSTANVTEFAVGNSLTFASSQLQTLAGTGDVTWAANSFATTIAANAVTNAKMATMAAFTFKGNNTSGSAVPTDVDIAALTTKASPAAGDYVMLSDQAASGAWKKATVSSLGGGGAGVTTLNGQTGAIVSYFPPQGRLTLQSDTPVMNTTQSAKTTIYYTPYLGDMVPLYDGTNMVPTAFTELSVATTDTTKSPAAIGASKLNDWFVWDDAGTLRLSHGPDWTSDTARSVGTALVHVKGIYLNNASITNGPAASRGTYIGTTKSNSSSQLDWIYGASSAGGTAAFFGVWNMYNRVTVTTTVTDSTASWNTATSATFASMNASTANRISAVFGFPEDGIRISIFARVGSVAVAFAQGNIGFAMDATNTADKFARAQATSSGLQIISSATAENNYAPQTGFHFWQAVDAGDGTNVGSIAGATAQGLNGQFRM